MINTLDPKIPAVAVDGTIPWTPEQIVEQLRVTRTHVPDFGPLPVPDARALRVVASLPAAFLRASFNTIGAAKAIADAVDNDSASLQAEYVDVARWSAVEDELRTLLHGIASANLARRHRLGLSALQAYNIARQLVRKKANADLIPHVAEMRRTNRLGRKKPAKDPADPIEPVPPVKL